MTETKEKTLPQPIIDFVDNLARLDAGDRAGSSVTPAIA